MVPSPQSQETGSIFQLHYKKSWEKSDCTGAVNNEGSLTLLNQLPMQSYKGQSVTRLLEICGEKGDYGTETSWEQIVDAFQQRNRPFKSFSIQYVLPWPFYSKDIKLANYISTHQLYEIVKTQALLQPHLRRERSEVIRLCLCTENGGEYERKVTGMHAFISFRFNQLLWQVIKRYESQIILKQDIRFPKVWFYL